ncbi:MAG TPA: hypothetical protein VKB86_17815 [Pyrinomonadaceae bacterium]|nr:hypothetical protein [Pyrinomonadaceae bacterium]
MAKNQTRRIKPSDLLEDEEVHNALKDIKNYAPANPDYAIAAIDTSYQEWKTAEAEEDQAAAVLAAKRDNAVAKSWAFHNKILGSKNQVIAQFGDNSDEAQAVKRKKKSEYKQRASKKSKPQG